MKKLEADTQFYRNEALRLDLSTNELRKTLRTLTGSLHAVGNFIFMLLDFGRAKLCFILYKNANVIGCYVACVRRNKPTNICNMVNCSMVFSAYLKY